MRYAMTSYGFAVVDDARRIGEFAYWSSDHWEHATRDPKATAEQMMQETWAACPESIRESHYRAVCRTLANEAI